MIIKSLLDQDLYKLAMGQVALHQFPWVHVKYEFKCRNQLLILDNKKLEHLINEVKNFCSLKFTDDELNYLSSINFLKPSYIDFLRLYSPNISHLTLNHSITKGLEISIKGPWFLTIYWEVPLLAMINEIYFSHMNHMQTLMEDGTNRLNKKIKIVKNVGFNFADFGTRRRFCVGWHNHIVRELAERNIIGFIGTSNVHLAQKYGIKPIGTMAHEFLQVGQALDVPLIDSQKRMLQSWVDEYRGDLGIALTDVIGIDAFLKDFDLYFAKLYDGLRHDSGSPYVWADKVIKHYEYLNINPKTKTLVFSDGLDFNKCAELYNHYKNRTNVSFGIGTNLTNDFSTFKPLQIVMKIVECNGRPVAKISDSPGKGMCRDSKYVDYLKGVFKVSQ